MLNSRRVSVGTPGNKGAGIDRKTRPDPDDAPFVCILCIMCIMCGERAHAGAAAQEGVVRVTALEESRRLHQVRACESNINPCLVQLQCRPAQGVRGVCSVRCEYREFSSDHLNGMA